MSPKRPALIVAMLVVASLGVALANSKSGLAGDLGLTFVASLALQIALEPLAQIAGIVTFVLMIYDRWRK